MGLSIRAAAIVRERVRQRILERAAQREAADKWAAENVDRPTAARILGVSCLTLRRWAQATNPPKGPRFTKHGTSQQARTTYPVSELREYARDPAAYEAARRAESLPG